MTKKQQKNNKTSIESKKNKSNATKAIKKVILISEGKSQRGRKPGKKYPNGYKKKQKNIIDNGNEIIKTVPEISREEKNEETSSENVIQASINPSENNIIINDNINSTVSNDNEAKENNIEPSSNVSNDFIKTGEDQFNSFISENFKKEDLINEEYKQETINEDYKADTKHYSGEMKQLVNGYMLLSICDFVFPEVIKRIMLFINPKDSDLIKKIKTKDVQLSEDQMKSLEKSADYVAQMVFAQLNPLSMFVLSLGVFYYSNMKIAIEEKRQEELIKESESFFKQDHSIIKKQPVKKVFNRNKK